MSCATISGSPAARKAAARVTAAPAASWSTAGWSAPAWCSRPRREGVKVETIEGMAEGDQLHPLQKKFVEMAALQCGICTPGFLIASKALLEKYPNPTEDRGPLLAGRQPLPLHGLRQDRHRGPRCGRRNEGVRTMSNQEHRPNTEGKYKWIGTRPDRPDGADKVTGRARFGADFSLPGQLIGKVLRTPARPRRHQVDRHVEGRGADRREGGDHREGLPRPAQPHRADRRDAGEHARRHAQHHGAREGAL